MKSSAAIDVASTPATSRLLLHAAHACMSPLGGRCLATLIFHRVLERPDPLFPAEMHASRFDRLMAVISRSYRVLALRDAANQLANGDLPRRSLAITFDDGYADNAQIALPILARHGLPATFFVSTGFLDGGIMWNDVVIESVRGTLLRSLDLGDLGLPRMKSETLAEKRCVIDAVLPQLKYLPPKKRDQAVATVVRLAGSPRIPSGLMMHSAQVIELSRSGMEIGGHTINHPVLTSIPLDEAEREMRACRERLQQVINTPVTSFAYPNGRPGKDYDAQHVELAKQAGFSAAASTAVGVARPGADLFQLPRFTPWDTSDLRWLMRLKALQLQS